jgi:hypothetical protein
MDSYLTQLKQKAEAFNVPLLKAFKHADIPTSTYYRNINEVVEMSHRTAVKVSMAIDYLALKERTREMALLVRNRRTARKLADE